MDLDNEKKKTVVESRVTDERCSHTLCRIDALQPAERASLSLLSHNGAVGLRKAFFFFFFKKQKAVLSLAPGRCAVNSCPLWNSWR